LAIEAASSSPQLAGLNQLSPVSMIGWTGASLGASILIEVLAGFEAHQTVAATTLAVRNTRKFFIMIFPAFLKPASVGIAHILRNPPRQMRIGPTCIVRHIRV
jgi:hypothetical protein